MDWQTVVTVIIVALAAGFLMWNNLRSRAKTGACAECLAKHKVSLKKRPPVESRRSR